MAYSWENNDLYLKTTGAILSTNPVAGNGYGTGAGCNITQASFTLASTAVVGTAGQCTCTATTYNLTVGTAVATTGTLTGTTTGIATSTTYYIIATNGSTSFILSATRGGTAIVTTAGTTTGLIFTINTSSARTTALYANAMSGSIQLKSAAGSATAASFVVNNSAFLADDVVTVNQKSGTDLYVMSITNKVNGAFTITSYTTGGTTTEQPVFSFAITRAVTA